MSTDALGDGGVWSLGSCLCACRFVLIGGVYRFLLGLQARSWPPTVCWPKHLPHAGQRTCRMQRAACWPPPDAPSQHRRGMCGWSCTGKWAPDMTTCANNAHCAVWHASRKARMCTARHARTHSACLARMCGARAPPPSAKGAGHAGAGLADVCWPAAPPATQWPAGRRFPTVAGSGGIWRMAVIA